MPVYMQKIGRHEIGYQGNLVFVCYHGAIVGSEMTLLMEYVAKVAAQYGPVYALVDANDTSWPDVDARRVMSTYGYKDIAALARYQSSLVASPQFTTLLQNAARLLGRPTTRAAAFATEAEARNWLNGLREGTAR